MGLHRQRDLAIPGGGVFRLAAQQTKAPGAESLSNLREARLIFLAKIATSSTHSTSSIVACPLRYCRDAKRFHQIAGLR
jgi:hypothetical protein